MSLRAAKERLDACRGRKDFEMPIGAHSTHKNTGGLHLYRWSPPVRVLRLRL